MKKKGFTLIELLAVIVILAIIALISTPIIINVIDRAQKGAFENSAYGVIDAAKLYYAESYLDGNTGEETFTFPADTKLKLSGTKPTGGHVVVDAEGKVKLSITNGKWCAIKSKNQEKVTITDYKDGKCDGVEIENPNPADPCFTVNPNDSSEINGYTCTDTDITIPSSIGGVEIKKIGSGAFYSKNITNVVIPNGIISIGDTAFQENQLTTIIIPGSVTSIGNYTFGLNKLTSVTMSDNISSIGTAAFASNQLTSIEIPNSITSIGNGAFSENQAGMNVIIDKPNGSIQGSPWGATSVQWNG